MAELAGRQILIVEDDAVLLEAMGQVFRRSGANVTLAADGAQALVRYQQAPFDLVVTDIIMPDREGIETIMAMKAFRPETPVLAISGGGRTPAGEFLKVAQTLGADAGLAKPFRSQVLLDAARQLLVRPHADVAA